MTVQTTSAYNWPDINKPHPCTCKPDPDATVMVTVQAKAAETHAWQLFTGKGSDPDYAEDDAMNHAVQWFGDEVLFGDEVTGGWPKIPDHKNDYGRWCRFSNCTSRSGNCPLGCEEGRARPADPEA